MKQLRIKAPGRINLLGEHLDYNQGVVLPAAIDRYIEFDFKENSSASFLIEAQDLNEQWAFLWPELTNSATSGWRNYVKGVLLLMQLDSHITQGLHIRFKSNIPIGAGLSSSAALCCGLAFGLNEFYGLKKTRMELALIAQQTEHEFAGVQCGLMDQVASLFGQEEHLLAFDCSTQEIKPFELHLHGAQLFLIDSKVKHNLADSAYNQRRASLEQAWLLAKNLFPNLANWQSITAQEANLLLDKLDAETQKRLRYVLEEMRRVHQMQALATQISANKFEPNDIQEYNAQLGSLINQTHAGLRDLYEVSCPELDFLQGYMLANKGIYGARIMGGGFGGCLLVLAKTTFSSTTEIAPIFDAYQRQFGCTAALYPVQIANGVQLI
jgi:galactokinase